MKQLVLLNPVTRRRRRVKFRSNPPYHEGFDKIFRKTRKTKRKTTRMAKSRRRRHSVRVVRRSHSRKRNRTTIVVPRRSPVLRAARRRFKVKASRALTIRSNPAGMMNKEIFVLGGGAAGAYYLTNFVLSKFGTTLPLAGNKFGKIAYAIGIPMIGAIVTRMVLKGRTGNSLALGMTVGGVASAISQGISTATAATTATTAATGQYLNSPPRPAGTPAVLGEYLQPVASNAFQGAWR